MKFYLLLGPHACLFQQHPRLPPYQCAAKASVTIKIDPNGGYSLCGGTLYDGGRPLSVKWSIRRFGGFYGLEECML
jgi:hypothetical protein